MRHMNGPLFPALVGTSQDSQASRAGAEPLTHHSHIYGFVQQQELIWLVVDNRWKTQM